MIRVLVAEGSPRIVANILSRLAREDDIEVVGSTSAGQLAVQEAIRLRPDVAIIDAGLPGMSGIEVTELVVQRLPKTGVIMLSMEGENDAFRQAMLAGAREFLQKPFKGDDLVISIRHVHESQLRKGAPRRQEPLAGDTDPAADADQPAARCMLISVVAGKGGVGKTTVAVNLAAQLARATRREVALLDLSLQFGDVAALLNLTVVTSIADIAANNAAGDPDVLEQVMVTAAEGMRVLLAPSSPELADYVTTAHIRALLEQLRSDFQFIVVDSPAYLTDVALDVLELADVIVVISDYSVTGVKNARLVRRVMDALKVDPAKLRIVINNHHAGTGLERAAAETHLQAPVTTEIPFDPAAVNAAMLSGLPFVSGQPEAPASLAIAELAAALTPLAQRPLAATQDQSSENKRPRRLLGFARG